jgi:hypothetical protein
MNIELSQIVLSIDGKLNLVRVPKDREHLALALLQSIFDDGRILVTPLPPEFQLIPLADVKTPA